MQDTHWASGSFDIFHRMPWETFMGSTISQTRKNVPNVNDAIRSWDITPVRQWLKENIHRKSNMMTGCSYEINNRERLKVNDSIEYLEDKCKSLPILN